MKLEFFAETFLNKSSFIQIQLKKPWKMTLNTATRRSIFHGKLCFKIHFLLFLSLICEKTIPWLGSVRYGSPFHPMNENPWANNESWQKNAPICVFYKTL